MIILYYYNDVGRREFGEGYEGRAKRKGLMAKVEENM